MCPKTEVLCHTGRRGTVFYQRKFSFNNRKPIVIIHFHMAIPTGSFEVQINDVLVHSKLGSLAFPDYSDVVRNVQIAAQGQQVAKVKEQPIKDCVIQ